MPLARHDSHARAGRARETLLCPALAARRGTFTDCNSSRAELHNTSSYSLQTRSTPWQEPALLQLHGQSLYSTVHTQAVCSLPRRGSLLHLPLHGVEESCTYHQPRLNTLTHDGNTFRSMYPTLKHLLTLSRGLASRKSTEKDPGGTANRARW